MRLSAAGEGCALVVQDQGEGVPAALQERMFDRFNKRDINSPGAGLGLSIVRQTARSLGGEARFATPSAIEVVLR